MENKDRPYSVAPYDPRWPEKFDEEKKLLLNIFKDINCDIQHVGSTSVEGMWAKPQIDILVVVDDLDEVEKVIPAMQAAGYVYNLDFFTEHIEKYFSRDAASGERAVSAHVMPKGEPRALRHIYFRDYLRSHSAERDLYSNVKKQACEMKLNRVEYSAWKEEVLNAIADRAKKWYDNNAK